jgi:hypothetical protein
LSKLQPLLSFKKLLTSRVVGFEKKSGAEKRDHVCYVQHPLSVGQEFGSNSQNDKDNNQGNKGIGIEAIDQLNGQGDEGVYCRNEREPCTPGKDACDIDERRRETLLEPGNLEESQDCIEQSCDNDCCYKIFHAVLMKKVKAISPVVDPAKSVARSPAAIPLVML